MPLAGLLDRRDLLRVGSLTLAAAAIPGSFVGISVSVPRISTGACGLGSKESMCVTPPAIQS